MRIPINWNAVTAVCAIVVALFTASGWLTDGLREDIRDLRQDMREELTGMRQEMRDGFAEMRKDIKDLRQDMREGFAETREDIEVLQQDVAFIKGQTRIDQTTNGNTQRSGSGK